MRNIAIEEIRNMFESEKLQVKSEELSNTVLNNSVQNRLCKFSTLHSPLSNLKGFTLAEVLITLGVIGVVAAVAMPVLMTNINERVNSERHANIAYKITQAMEQMRAHGKLVQYESTEKFVDELQKYLKIQKRCSASNIAECWPTETVTDASGEEYNVADCKQRKNLIAGSDSEDNNVGLLLADGASIILTYDNTSQGMDISNPIISDNEYPLPVGNGKYKNFAYTTSVTGSIDFVTDVNGKRNPNSETINGKYHDIRQFRNARFINPIDPDEAACTGDYYKNKTQCVKYIGSNYDGLDCKLAKYGGTNTSSEDFAKYCGIGTNYNIDYWSGANKACDLAGMKLPNMSELQEIYNDRAHYPSIPSNAGNIFASDLEYADLESACDWLNFNDGTPGGGGKYRQQKVICINKN